MSNLSVPSLANDLRRAIQESGMSLQALGQATGVERGSISRFVKGQRSLRLDKAEKLAAFFGLSLTGNAKAKNRQSQRQR
jgi:transcriptional regulator with XRE-family HTH domain